MKITVQDFVQEFKDKKIVNSRVNEHAVSDYIKERLEVKTYVPFKKKREIAEMIIEQCTEVVDGIKKHDTISAYVGFVVAMISTHTALTFSDDPVADYDLLAESGLLPQIVAEFKQSYDECDVVLKMALAMELEDNNVNVLIGHFLNQILGMLDGVGNVLKEKLDDFDLGDILGADFKHEDLAKLSGFLDKIK